MAQQVCLGATLKCSFGLAPSTLMVLPKNMVQTSYVPAANILDNIPMVNILPFGMCTCTANPAVAAATAAALGTPTPAPCIPVTPAPWAPGATTVLIAYQPALDNTSKLNCVYGGIIEVVVAGQTTHQIP